MSITDEVLLAPRNEVLAFYRAQGSALKTLVLEFTITKPSLSRRQLKSKHGALLLLAFDKVFSSSHDSFRFNLDIQLLSRFFISTIELC